MSSITQVREDDIKFDLIINDNMPEYFTDGFSQLMLGNPVSKLVFHTIVSPVISENDIEQRQGVLRLTMSTPVLLELCRNVLAASQKSIDALGEGGKQVDAQVRKIMESVSVTMPTRSEQVKSRVKKPKSVT